jgi:hypothetical protein
MIITKFLATAAVVVALATPALADNHPAPKPAECFTPNHPGYCDTLRAINIEIQEPRHDRMVCERVEDVRPANEAWLRLINRMKSVGMSPDRVSEEIKNGEVGKWIGPCGLIKAGKAALVREDKVYEGVRYICVEIFANRASAEYFANVVNKCHWAPEFSQAYTNEDSPADLAPADVRNSQTTTEDKLYEVYWRYAFVQYCHQVRQGYEMIFVSDPEFYRAQTIAKAVAVNAKGVDTDKIWRQALDHNNDMPVSRDWCQRAYRESLEMSPVAVFDMQKP